MFYKRVRLNWKFVYRTIARVDISVNQTLDISKWSALNEHVDEHCS